MRLDVRDIDDPVNMQRCAKCKVFLDGVEQRFCIAADDVAGVIERYKHDQRGRIVVTMGTGIAKIENIKGHVRITFPEGA
jgi:hypothetical protein